MSVISRKDEVLSDNGDYESDEEFDPNSTLDEYDVYFEEEESTSSGYASDEITEGGDDFILDYSAQDIVEQLTLIDFYHLQEVNARELISSEARIASTSVKR